MGREVHQQHPQPATQCGRSRVHMKAPRNVEAPKGKIRDWEPARLKWMNHDKGYGYLSRPGERDIHIFLGTLAAAGLATLREGQLLEVRWRMEPKGPHAMYVRSVWRKKGAAKQSRHKGAQRRQKK